MSLEVLSLRASSVLEMNEFIEGSRISKQFALDVANAMPAELYNRKRNPDQMIFGEQLVRTAREVYPRFEGIGSPDDTF